MRKIVSSIIAVAMGTLYFDVSFAEWTYKEKVDRMTDKKKCFAVTDYVKSLEPMEFPYTGTKSAMIVYCSENFVDLEECTVAFTFTSDPNLTNIEFDEVGPYVITRMRFDKNPPKKIKLYVGDEFLLANDGKILYELPGHKKLLLELNWFGNGLTYFEYPIEGGDQIIEKLKEGCQIKIGKDGTSGPDTGAVLPDWTFRKIVKDGELKACHTLSGPIEPSKAPAGLDSIAMRVRLMCPAGSHSADECMMDFLFNYAPPLMRLEEIDKGAIFITTARIQWDNSPGEAVRMFKLRDKGYNMDLLVPVSKSMRELLMKNLLEHDTLTIKLPLADGNTMVYRFYLKGISDVMNNLMNKCEE